MCSAITHVRFGPKADIASLIQSASVRRTKPDGMVAVHRCGGPEREALARVNFNRLPFKGDSNMNKRDWELLDKQLWGVNRSPPDNGIMFLVGIGLGDILSKTKQVNANSNTNYAAIFPNENE
jgi:hypothetical protein